MRLQVQHGTCGVTAAASAACTKPVVRLLASAGLFALAMTLSQGDAWAKHRKSATPSDPCVTMTAQRQRIIGQMKAVNKVLASEQAVPNTLAGVFERMQGKAYIDHTKTDQVARLRQEADDLQKAMRVAGCTLVDIDAELKNPSIARIR